MIKIFLQNTTPFQYVSYIGVNIVILLEFKILLREPGVKTMDSH